MGIAQHLAAQGGGDGVVHLAFADAQGLQAITVGDEPQARARLAPAVVDVDESDTAENFELPGADLSGEELSVRVVPKQADEFTCSSCFLVHHRSRLASEKNGVMICTDCAA